MKITLFSIPTVFAVTLAVGGCDVRDAEADSIPGAARTTRSASEETGVASTEGENARAGINSAGLPASSAGGNTGPTVIGERESSHSTGATRTRSETRGDTPPRRTDIPASSGPGVTNGKRLNERKPMPNDGERANTPGTPPPVSVRDTAAGDPLAGAVAAARKALAADPALARSKIRVTADNGKLVLQGTVPTNSNREEAATAVQKSAPAVAVVNRIAVE